MTESTSTPDERPQRLDQKLNRWVRWFRRVAVVAMVVIAGMIFRIYDFETLKDAQWEALQGKQRMRRQAFLIFKRIDEDTKLGVGSLVEARVQVPPNLAKRIGRDEGGILSEIAGVPGMSISLEPQTDGTIMINVDGESTGSTFELGWQMGIAHHLQIRDGPIPEGYYLLLNPNPDAEAIDSRKVGLVPFERLERKASHL